MKVRVVLALVLAFAAASEGRAAIESAPSTFVAKVPAKERAQLSDQLRQIRTRVLDVEQSLVDGLKSQQRTETNVGKIKLLIGLQRKERALGQKRLAELQSTVDELEARHGTLDANIRQQESAVRGSLIAIQRSMEMPAGDGFIEQERIEAPRRKVLANLADRGLKEVEALRIDLADAETLGLRIQEEKSQLAYLFQDLNEQESVLELNRQLQSDILRKKHNERMAQLESYRKLRSAEGQVETLIQDFNARLELERTQETERQASRATSQTIFAGLKGKLSLPVSGGKVLSSFGRSFDQASKLFVFKKGIDIRVDKKQPVFAVSAGKVAFAGELAGYGRVTIVDHGEHFYSLCAHLGELSRKAGDTVAVGETIGVTDDQATPVYFEIRARNVAVNPLQWISN